jgi:hypothetical protein
VVEKMVGLPHQESTLQTEQLVLQALCQGTTQGSVHLAARRILSGYRWREPLHQAAFDAVMSLPADDPHVIRHFLPGRLTRRGFPDFDLENFFKPHGLSAEEAEKLMEQLVKSASA